MASPATLLFTDPGWRRAYRTIATDVQRAVALTLAHQRLPRATLNVLFTDDAELRSLNAQFRGKNSATNVLSFPSGEADFLGDIALAYGVVKKEKTEQSKTWRAHTLHLVVHGVLHLLGYDHENDADAEEMEALEIALLSQLYVANPYR